MFDNFFENQQELRNTLEDTYPIFNEEYPRPLDDPFFGEIEFRDESRPNNGEQIKEIVEDECSICITYFIYPTDDTIREWKVCYNKPSCQRSEQQNGFLRFSEEPELPEPPEFEIPATDNPYELVINNGGNFAYRTGWCTYAPVTQSLDILDTEYYASIPAGYRVVSENLTNQIDFPGGNDGRPPTTGRAWRQRLKMISPSGFDQFIVFRRRNDGGTTFGLEEGFIAWAGRQQYAMRCPTEGLPWWEWSWEVYIEGGHSVYEVRTVGHPNPFPDNNPIPPQPPEEINMNCCDDVRLRLRRIQDDMTILMRWTGARPGQMKVPKTFLKPDGLPETFIDKIKDLFGFNEQTIKSLPEFFNWQMERLQEYMGEWPIESRSPNGGKLNIPNIAMASQALLDKAIAEGEMNQMIGAASAKSLLEVGLARENIALIVSQLEAIIDFLDMEVTERQQDINHGFTMPDADNSELPSVDVNQLDTPQELSDFLVESVRPMKVIELSPNQASFGDLRLAVDKIKALLSPVTVSKDDTPAQIKTKLKPEEEENNSPDFVNWVTIETQSGESNPWGDSLNERPDINSLPPIS